MEGDDLYGYGEGIFVIRLAGYLKEEQKTTLAIDVANAVGEELTAVNHSRGLSWTGTFVSAESTELTEWTSVYNDAVNQYGSVFYRNGSKGDYYGVLKGSAEVGVPGLIIEHGFHTIPVVRRQAMESDLAAVWARADARGIARGFGLIN